jgi:polyisoprenoid-binding protein YceI
VASESPADAPVRPRPSGRRRTALLGAVAVVVLVVAGLLWYLNRSTPAPVATQAALEAAQDAADAGPGGAEDAAAGDDPARDDQPDDPGDATGSDEGSDDAGDADDVGDAGELDPTGTWTVDRDQVPYDLDAGTGSFVGFRVDEELATVGATTAVGRTPAVDGEITIEGTTLTSAVVVADLTALRTDIAQRDNRVQQALDTGAHPEATFTLSEPIALDEVPPVGAVRAVDATGELTIGGVTRPVTVPLEAVLLTADTMLVTGSVEIVLDDFGIVVPSAPIVVSVADTGTIELQLHLRRR